MPLRRPTSVTAAAIMCIVLGGLGTSAGMCGVVLMAANLMPENKLEDPMPSHPVLQGVAALVQLGYLIALLTAGIGLLRLAKWARTVGIAAAGVGILSELAQISYQAIFVIPVVQQLPAEFFVKPGRPPQEAEIARIVTIVTPWLAIAFMLGIVGYLAIIIYLLCRARARAAFSGQFLTERAVFVRGLPLDYVADKVADYGRLTDPNNPLHHFALRSLDDGWVLIGIPYNLNRYNFHNLANWMLGLSSDRERAAEVIAVNDSEKEPEDTYYLVPNEEAADTFIGRREDGAAMKVDIPVGDVQISAERTRLTEPLNDYLRERGIPPSVRSPYGFVIVPERELTIAVDDSSP